MELGMSKCTMRKGKGNKMKELNYLTRNILIIFNGLSTLSRLFKTENFWIQTCLVFLAGEFCITNFKITIISSIYKVYCLTHICGNEFIHSQRIFARNYMLKLGCDSNPPPRYHILKPYLLYQPQIYAFFFNGLSTL